MHYVVCGTSNLGRIQFDPINYKGKNLNWTQTCYKFREKTCSLYNQVYIQIRFQGSLETDHSLPNLINYLEVYFPAYPLCKFPYFRV